MANFMTHLRRSGFKAAEIRPGKPERIERGQSTTIRYHCGKGWHGSCSKMKCPCECHEVKP